MSVEWQETVDGFATGPVVTVGDPAGGDVEVKLSTYWTDEDGLQVDVYTADNLIPARMLSAVAAALARLQDLPVPAPAGAR